MALIGIVAAIGGFILLAVLIWAKFNNAGRSARSREISEAASRDLYAAEEANRRQTDAAATEDHA